jgi:hypothetical protein
MYNVDNDAVTPVPERTVEVGDYTPQDTYNQQRLALGRLRDQIEVLYLKTINHLRHCDRMQSEPQAVEAEIEEDFWQVLGAVGRIKISLLPRVTNYENLSNL